MSFEEQLVKSCSPTLAGLKSGNLFRYRCNGNGNAELKEWNTRLAAKGISIRAMRNDEEYVLTCVYRRSMIENDLRKEGVRSFLSGLGYDCDDTEAAIEMLSERMENEDFPHEVGLFLGYPLHDVMGFINNCGRDCRFCGCWKVYDDEHQTKEQFVQFRECRKDFIQKFDSGIGAEHLAV